MKVLTQTLEREAPELEAPAVAPTCEACGHVSAPDGTCLELGECSRADAIATRGASIARRGAPRAWTVRGSVD
jgi:hypothetical protein